ncbi:MAG: trimethylamine--corrinoid protein Co-methyltransferase [Desulforhopalus sp.]|jgi:trimethylamine--corrinoid protein Co-methyltransferase
MSIESYFQVVGQKTLAKVHQASLNVLANTGIVFQSEECLEIFKNNGAKVSGKTVLIPENMVTQALESAPSSFDWVARDEEKSIQFGSDQAEIHVSLNNGPIYIQDQDNGRRLGKEEDLVNLYKLAHNSNTCNIVGQIPVEPSDITGPTRHLEIFRRLLKHSDKPLFGYVGNTLELEQMFTMMKIASGNSVEDETFFDVPRIAVSLNPLSPLQFDQIPCQTILQFARRRQPIMVLTCSMAGVTSPVDPMGTVVLQNVEILAGLVLAQLISPGTPVVYSPASAIPNLRTGAYVTGLPMSGLINMVGVQLARDLYHLPSRCMAGLTDAKTVDAQAGYETMQNYLMLAMSGVNMVNECYGLLDMIMTVSYEKFLIDDEIMARAAQVVRGIDSYEDDLSESIISESGHGASYLMHPTTMKHCRGFWTPPLSTIDSYQGWEKKGGQDVADRANTSYKEILSNCPETILDNDLDQDLLSFIKNSVA